MNCLLTLRFLGTHYHGFQIQQNALSVQQVFQDALAAVFGARPDIKACSRTDAGVHANRFYVSLFVPDGFSLERLPDALNNNLPPDVRVLAAREVPAGFHARYNCVEKRYVYRVYNAHTMDPFWVGRAMHLPWPALDAAALERVAGVFVGRHDFAAFCGKKNRQQDTERTITHFTVSREGEFVLFAITADGFLYNMVRILVGTLLGAARGKLGRGDICAIMESRRRASLCITAPAEGLYLDEAWFDFTEAAKEQADDQQQDQR